MLLPCCWDRRKRPLLSVVVERSAAVHSGVQSKTFMFGIGSPAGSRTTPSTRCAGRGSSRITNSLTALAHVAKKAQVMAIVISGRTPMIIQPDASAGQDGAFVHPAEGPKVGFPSRTRRGVENQPFRQYGLLLVLALTISARVNRRPGVEVPLVSLPSGRGKEHGGIPACLGGFTRVENPLEYVSTDQSDDHRGYLPEEVILGGLDERN